MRNMASKKRKTGIDSDDPHEVMKAYRALKSSERTYSDIAKANEAQARICREHNAREDELARAMGIPVGADGYVPIEALQQHALEHGADDGASPNERLRRATIDYVKQAKTYYSTPITPGKAIPWWQNPARSDILGIDTPGPARTDIGERTGKRAKAQKNIRVYGTAEDERQIRRMLDENYSADQLQEMSRNGLDVYIVPYVASNVGRAYTGRDIIINRTPNGRYNAPSGLFGEAYDTQIGLEGTKALRRRGADRKGASRSARRYSQPERNTRDQISLEESQALAEVIAKQTAPTQSTDVLYYKVPVMDSKSHRWRDPTPEEARAMYIEDRRILKTSGSAKKSVEKNWMDTNLSRLRLGDIQAINYAKKKGMVKDGKFINGRPAALHKKKASCRTAKKR